MTGIGGSNEPAIRSVKAQWSCPEPQAPSPEQNDRARLVYEKIEQLTLKSERPERLAGFELEIALYLLGNEQSVQADNSFWQAKCRAMFTRPAIEPIVYTYWTRFTRQDFTQQVALEVVSSLSGRQLALREKPIIGKAESGNIAFEELPKARLWLTDIFQVAEDANLAPILPAYAFVRTIMAHPFPDGNGRLARFMVHASLGHMAGVTRPSVGIAPVFYCHANRLASAMQVLSASKDWQRFYKTFFDVLDHAADIARHYLRRNALTQQ